MSVGKLIERSFFFLFGGVKRKILEDKKIQRKREEGRKRKKI